VDLTITPVMPRKKYTETTFGERLIGLRKARGMTQMQLAKAAKTTQRAISADELLGIKPQPREASKFEQVTGDPESMRLWKRFQRITLLPERDQRAVIRLINSLTGATGADAHD
jgi:transcriptional regulator with XRE-family HTH domain